MNIEAFTLKDQTFLMNASQDVEKKKFSDAQKNDVLHNN